MEKFISKPLDYRFIKDFKEVVDTLTNEMVLVPVEGNRTARALKQV